MSHSLASQTTDHRTAAAARPAKFPERHKRRQRVIEEMLLWALLVLTALALTTTLYKPACNAIRKVTSSASWVIHPAGGADIVLLRCLR